MALDILIRMVEGEDVRKDVISPLGRIPFLHTNFRRWLSLAILAKAALLAAAIYFLFIR